MSQRTTCKEPTQYLYDSKTWLYKLMYAFFYGIVQNDDYAYDVKPTKKVNILPITLYTYDAFSVLNSDYDYFCGNMAMITQYTYDCDSAIAQGIMPGSETGLIPIAIGIGARFPIAIGSSDLSIWLSVDPLDFQYPGISPYNYCFYNPIMFKDLWGLEGEPTKARIRKVKSDREGQEKFRFKNKQTGERGYVYAPEGSKTKDVRNNINNKKHNNLDIYTFDKNQKPTKEEHYDNEGESYTMKQYDLSGVDIIDTRTNGKGIGYSYNTQHLSYEDTKKLINTNQQLLEIQAVFITGMGLSSFKKGSGSIAFSTFVLSSEAMIKAHQLEEIEESVDSGDRKGTTVETWQFSARGTFSFPMSIKYVKRNSDNNFLGIIWH